jgi:hypothetical protein
MQPNFSSNRRRDILLLIFSIAGMLGLVSWGFYPVIMRLAFPGRLSTTSPSYSITVLISMLVCAALLLPLLVTSIRKLRGLTLPLAKLPPIKFWQLAALFGIWLVLVIVGSILDTLPGYGAGIGALFFPLGIALPIAAIVWVAIGGLPVGSWRRIWATLGISMVGSTLVAVILEYSLVGSALVVAGSLAAFNPKWLAILQQVRQQLGNSSDMQALLTTLAPYLTNPLVFLVILFFTAVVAPVIEETIKPAAVWLLGKRLQSPAQGFALGAICGAGFAMLEGTLAGSSMGQMLGIGSAVRLPSSLMHITASGLMGWAIASFRLHKRTWRLVGMFLLSAGIHGLWNGSVVLGLFGALRFTLQTASPDLLGSLLVLVGIGLLGALLVAIMVLLPILNRRLRPAHGVIEVPSQGDIIAPLQS